MKIQTAIQLFIKKKPSEEIIGIFLAYKNWYHFTVASGDTYTVSLENNSVEPYYPDP